MRHARVGLWGKVIRTQLQNNHLDEGGPATPTALWWVGGWEGEGAGLRHQLLGGGFLGEATVSYPIKHTTS